MAKKNQDPISLLIKDLEKKTGGTFLPMEDLEDSQPSSPSSAWLLTKKHIILSRPVATLAFQVKRKLQLDNAGSYIMMYDTSTGDETWEVMFSLMPKIKKDLKKMDWSASLGRLLGILLYATGNDIWIRDNEVWDEEKKFTKWFSDYSQAWKEVLKRSDEELGLALEGGREGGYRSTLLKQIEWWQRSTNQLLDDLYNGKNNHNFNVKVDILNEEEMEQDSGSTAESQSEASSSVVSKTSKRKSKEDTKGKAKKIKTTEVKAVSGKKKNSQSGSK